MWELILTLLKEQPTTIYLSFSFSIFYYLCAYYGKVLKHKKLNVNIFWSIVVDLYNAIFYVIHKLLNVNIY